MKNFYTFWQAHYPPVRPEAEAYIHAHHKIKTYKRGEVIKLPHEIFPFLCIVLQGLVGGYRYSRSGRESMRELAIPLDFFTGTPHPFSNRQQPMEYRALQNTRLLVLSLKHVQEAQQLYQEVSELIHILKQRKILRLRKLVEVYQEEKGYDRFVEYMEQLKELALLVPIQYQAELLHIHAGHLRKLRKRYAEER